MFERELYWCLPGNGTYIVLRVKHTEKLNVDGV